MWQRRWPWCCEEGWCCRRPWIVVSCLVWLPLFSSSNSHMSLVSVGKLPFLVELIDRNGGGQDFSFLAGLAGDMRFSHHPGPDWLCSGNCPAYEPYGFAQWHQDALQTKTSNERSPVSVGSKKVPFRKDCWVVFQVPRVETFSWNELKWFAHSTSPTGLGLHIRLLLPCKPGHGRMAPVHCGVRS